MNSDVLAQLAGLTLFSVVAAVAVLWVLAQIGRRTSLSDPTQNDTADDAVTFLFEGTTLIDATSAAKQIMPQDTEPALAWGHLIDLLSLQFPNLSARLDDLADQSEISIMSENGTQLLRASRNLDLIRLTLAEPPVDASNVSIDRGRLNAIEREIETLRATAQHAPFLVWRQNNSGQITWANTTYLDLAGPLEGDGGLPVWPPVKLFDLHNSEASDPPAGSRRLTAHIQGEAEPRWFESFETKIGNESLFTAVAADRVVKAEVALRDFVQTLTKTFAHLTIGLAIFDKQRRLALFNPALADLTSLSAGFLSQRPTFHTVLDKMRENQMAPEPKDYKSWRRKLYELEVAATNGTYEETWSLPNGCTYRITGRPHPDGAVAFLFEDISAEISSTRRFRADLKSSQSVLDSFSEAIAVFSPSGNLLLTNLAYSQIWDVDPTTVLGDFGIIEATRTWSEKCAATPVWGDAREFVANNGDRSEWTADVQLFDGRNLSCRFRPIAGGETLVGFNVVQSISKPEPPAPTAIEQLSAEIAAL